MRAETTVLSDLHHEVRGQGVPILFIAGASGDAGHFTRLAEELAGEYTTISYDRRGCSRSAALPEGEEMSIAAQADDATALIEELGLAPAILFGSSAGGNIVLEMIARRRSAVRSAIVHEPALIAVAPDPDAEAKQLAPIVGLAAGDPRQAMEAFWRFVSSDETFESLEPALRERMLGNGAHFFARELAAIATYVPDTDRLRDAGVPVRPLASRNGIMEFGVRWVRDELDVEAGLVSGHHAPYLQDPERLAEELRPILRTLDGSSL